MTRCIGIVLCLLFSPIVGYSSANDPVAQDGRSSPPKLLGIHDFFEPGVPYSNMWLPSAMGSHAHRNVQRQLLLSDAQEAFSDRIYEELVLEFNDVARELLPAFLEASAAAASHSGLNVDYAENLAAADELRRQFESAIEEQEERYFDRLRPVLTREQEELIERVKVDRRRLRCGAAGRSISLPAFSIELRPLVESLDRSTLDPESQGRIESMLDTHEQQMTPVMCAFADAVRDVGEKWLLYAERVDLERDAHARHAVRIAEINGKINRLHRQVSRAATQVRDRNESWLAQLMTLLPERLAETLERRYRVAAYPSAFEGVEDLYPTYATIEESEALSDDERAQVGELRRAYFARDRIIARAIGDELVRRRLEFEGDSGGHGAHRATMAGLAGKRSDLARDHLRMLKELLGDRLDELTGGSQDTERRISLD